MNANSSGRDHKAFTILRANLSHLNLPPVLVEELLDRQMQVAFEKGAMAFCQGSADGMFGCILTGYIKVYCPVGDGNRTLVRLAGPGEVIGFADYFDDRGRNARLFEGQAATKCRLALFSRLHVASVLAGLPSENLVSIVSALNTFWSANVQYFATLLGLPLWNRLTLVVTDLAKRAGARDSEGILLIPEICQDDLAEMIGCSRPMVSRLLGEMLEAGLIARRGKQYVLLSKWNSINSDQNLKGTCNAEIAIRRQEVVRRTGPRLLRNQHPRQTAQANR